MKSVILILLLLLAGCVLQDPGFRAEKCDLGDRFSCEASLGKDILFTLTNNGPTLKSAELEVKGDCFDQVILGPLVENSSDTRTLCASQLLDDTVKLTLLLTYEEDGQTKKEKGVLRVVR